MQADQNDSGVNDRAKLKKQMFTSIDAQDEQPAANEDEYFNVKINGELHEKLLDKRQKLIHKSSFHIED